MSDNKSATSTATNTNSKQSIFRLSGAAALVGTIGVIGVSSYLFADDIAKYAIVNSMETTFGAQTDIAQVELTWAPFGLTIHQLAQTDQASAQHNLFEFEQASVQLDLWQLLLGKYIMEQVSVDKLAFATERQQPGEVYQPVLDKEAIESISNQAGQALSFSVPTAEQLLANLDLQTEVKGRALEQVWQQEKPKLEQAFKQLPDKQKLEQLKQQWRKLTDSKLKSLDDLAQLKKQLEQIKAELEQEKQSLQTARQQYQDSKQKLDHAYQELQQAAKDDWRKVEQTIPFNDPNAVAIAKLLFGPEVAGYVDQAQTLWVKVQPYMQQQTEQKQQAEQAEAQKWASSKEISFAMAGELPDWLVRQLRVSVLRDEKLFQVSGTDINLQSYKLEQPSLYQVKLADKFDLSGQYFVTRSAQISTSGHWQASGLQFDNKTLSDSDSLNLSLASAKVSGKGDYRYQDNWNSTNQFGFSETKFQGEASTKLAKLTLDTLTQVDSFALDLALSGTPEEPSIDIKSDLDKQLGKGLTSAFNQQWQGVKSSTKSQLQDKLKQQFNLTDTDLGKFANVLGGLDKDFSSFGSVDDVIEQQKKKYQNKLKDKAKDKLKEKLKGFFGN